MGEMKHRGLRGQRSDPSYAEQVRLLYANGPLAFTTTVLTGAILAYVQAAVVPVVVVLLWYGCLLIVTALRALGTRRYHSAAAGPDRARFWNFVYVVGAAAAGAVWGAAGVVLFPPDSIAHQVFVAFVLAGMAAGGISVLAPRIEACLGFLLPALLPLSIQYLSLRSPMQTAMGVLTLIFLAGMAFTAWTFHRAIRTSLHLRFDKQELEAEVERRQRAEERLSHEKERLHTTVSSIGEGVVLIDADGRIEYLNPAAERLFRLRFRDVSGGVPSEVFKCFADRGEHVSTALEDSLRSGAAQKKQCVLHDRKRGKWVIEELATPLLDRHGKLAGAVSVFRNVTEEQERTERLMHAATHDGLTGLPNRDLLKDRVRRSIARAHRKHESFALLFIDLDEFKSVNDTLGHASGDELLIGVARRLAECVREEDTVARLGGDEFVVLLDGPTDPRHLEAVADKMRRALCEPFQLGAKAVRISGSVGASVYPDDGSDVESLLVHADAAMYGAKHPRRERNV